MKQPNILEHTDQKNSEHEHFAHNKSGKNAQWDLEDKIYSS